MSKKKIITIFSLLLVGILTVSAISYAIAGLSNGDEKEIQTATAPKAAGTYVSAIDMIIENSYKAENNTFNIVEVLPMGSSPSALKDYATNGNFKSFVIDANRTITQTMNDNCILYDYIPVNNTSAMTDRVTSTILGGTATISDVLNKADLIYLTSPGYNSYLPEGASSTKGMSEEVYDYLHTYASGKNKPLIMDFVKSTDVDTDDSKTYETLVDAIQLNYIRYKTFPWVDGYTASQFFKNQDGGNGRSRYIIYSGAAQYNVLDISDSSSGGPIKAAMEDEYDSLKTRIYYGSEEPQPLTYNVKSPAELDADPSILDSHYDFIVIESSVKPSSISDDVYSKIKTLSESGRYIFYGTNKVVSGSGESGGTATNNYLKLMNLLMTANGLSRQKNVMSVRPGFFTVLNNDPASDYGKEKANEIAKLLNNSDYRGSSTNGESRKFRVLEIEPSYPIDIKVAEASSVTTSKYTQNDCYGPIKGGYYIEPDQVMFGVSKDEVPDQEHGEYYAFQMSRAKIAQITGINYDNIIVDQMSVNEAICSKKVLAETYDMVYIGGNSSAYVQSTHVNLGQSIDWTGSLQNDYLENRFTNFDMYTHTGYLAAYRLENGFGSIGSASDTSVVVSGHDLTMNNMQELNDYV
ncbi:MAG: hypothetical protein ACI4F4_06425, partial [Lachnospiraceae bacterium]